MTGMLQDHQCNLETNLKLQTRISILEAEANQAKASRECLTAVNQYLIQQLAAKINGDNPSDAQALRLQLTHMENENTRLQTTVLAFRTQCLSLMESKQNLQVAKDSVKQEHNAKPLAQNMEDLLDCDQPRIASPASSNDQPITPTDSIDILCPAPPPKMTYRFSTGPPSPAEVREPNETLLSQHAPRSSSVVGYSTNPSQAITNATATSAKRPASWDAAGRTPPSVESQRLALPPRINAKAYHFHPHGYKEYRDVDSPPAKEDRDPRAPRVTKFKDPRALRSYADLDSDAEGSKKEKSGDSSDVIGNDESESAAKNEDKSGDPSDATDGDEDGSAAKKARTGERSEEREVVDIGDLY